MNSSSSQEKIRGHGQPKSQARTIPPPSILSAPVCAHVGSREEKRKTASCPFSWWLPHAGMTNTSWGGEAEWHNGALPQAWQKASGRREVMSLIRRGCVRMNQERRLATLLCLSP